MEYRGRPERVSGSSAWPEAGPRGAGLFRRDAAACEWQQLPDCGRLPRRPQPAGRDPGRNRQTYDPQPDESFLCAAKQNNAVNKGSAAAGGQHDSDRILDNLSTAIVLLDENFLIQELNPAAENLLGISRNRALGKPMLPLVDDDKGFRDVLMRVLETGASYASELQLGPSEVHSHHRLVDCRVSQPPGSDGRLTILVEMTDVTRRSRINRENALIIQHGAGRQMIRQLAHEIKNPLGGLRGAAQLLDRELTTSEQHEYTKVIISEADRLAALVDTLLGPGGPPNKTYTNIHEILEHVVQLIQAEAGNKLRICRDYDPSLPLINLDRNQIVQAVLNIVRNAATALEGHGCITLRSRAISNFTIGDTRHRVVASIEVEDDGPGIPAELQDSVFYPLVTSRPDGTGLGLPAAQELLSRHHGLIEFESRPGQTTFLIRIPLEKPMTKKDD